MNAVKRLTVKGCLNLKLLLMTNINDSWKMSQLFYKVPQVVVPASQSSSVFWSSVEIESSESINSFALLIYSKQSSRCYPSTRLRRVRTKSFVFCNLWPEYSAT